MRKLLDILIHINFVGEVIFLFKVSVASVETKFTYDFFGGRQKWYTFQTTDNFDLDFLE